MCTYEKFRCIEKCRIHILELLKNSVISSLNFISFKTLAKDIAKLFISFFYFKEKFTTNIEHDYTKDSLYIAN